MAAAAAAATVTSSCLEEEEKKMIESALEEADQKEKEVQEKLIKRWPSSIVQFKRCAVLSDGGTVI
jgi:3-keto-L-gulonate-6-phosphate decarboxylase